MREGKRTSRDGDGTSVTPTKRVKMMARGRKSRTVGLRLEGDVQGGLKHVNEAADDVDMQDSVEHVEDVMICMVVSSEDHSDLDLIEYLQEVGYLQDEIDLAMDTICIY
ncbi:hypothetical protein L2E82_17275 [Cichorium intybus]|uniref:Uncharacterized protein n=1 Tax=Cichorium intybus TaxID=13427 RepID=A0ACB9F934_CICIN|nr:hypothetical protein L2E82_17275 [Cichorium intybus]